MSAPHRVILPIPHPLNRPVEAITFTVEGAEAAPSPAVEFCCFLYPAMAQRLPLQLSAPLDTPLAANTERIMATLASWFPTLSPMSVEPAAATAAVAPRPASTRTALFFTGGVDSFHALVRDRDAIDALVLVIGFDLLPEQTDLCRQTIDMLHEVADHFGKQAVVVTSNLRPLFDTCLGWGKTHGAALAAVSHLLAPSLGRAFIASSFRTDQVFPWGTHPELDPLWSTRTMQVHHRHAETGRVDKIREIAADPFVLRHLRVCWQNTGNAYNCGYCAKCLRTRFALDLAGAPPDAAPFASPFEPERLIELTSRLAPESPDRIFIPELTAAFRAAGRTDDRVARALFAAEAAIPPLPVTVTTPALEIGPTRITTAAGRVSLTTPVEYSTVRTELRVAFPMATPPPRCGDAHALWFLLQAMRLGSDLHLRDPVSSDLLARLDQAQQIIATLPVFEGLRPIRIRANRVEPPLPPAPPDHPWAAAFGGGIDGWYTLLQYRDTTRYIVHLHGIDQITPDPNYRSLVSGWLHEAAIRAGVDLIEVDTNLRQVLVRDLGGRWDETYAFAPYGMAHLLQPVCAGLRMGSDLTYTELQQCLVTTKNHPLLKPLLRSAAMCITHEGMDTVRHEKAAWLARHHPWVLPLLQVCSARLVSGFRGGRNCGMCEKCLRTLAAFRVCGALELAQCAFDTPFDPARLAATTIPRSGAGEFRVLYHLAMLQALKERGDDPVLQQALTALILRSRAVWPKGPLPSITDAYPRWKASPAWPAFVHDHAEALLDQALPLADPREVRGGLDAAVLDLWPKLVRQSIARRSGFRRPAT
ncbi:MAG TPA: hypothetical protein PKC67_15250 [Kiritimatiellia bacterium]|nr:hypothetical protein [Kiritimatiellia bacterium]HMP35691.1 hypothetical protein [Kiritimatiellia bacterium]